MLTKSSAGPAAEGDSPALVQLVASLALEAGPEADGFLGHAPPFGWRRLYGGHVVAQALAAAQRTVPTDRPIHALHGLFLLPGDPALPVLYRVARLRDGRSFASRRVEAWQHGAVIFAMLASFHDREDGLAHQQPMPAAPPPESLPSEAALAADPEAPLPEPVRRYFARERPIELRPVDLARYLGREVPPPGEIGQRFWMRARGTLPPDPALHACVLAYLSDMTVLDTALVPHGRSVFDPALQLASLDHSLWFHRPADPSAWLLHVLDSPAAAGGRGLGRGAFFAQDGTLVASVAQEGLMRLRSPRATA